MQISYNAVFSCQSEYTFEGRPNTKILCSYCMSGSSCHIGARVLNLKSTTAVDRRSEESGTMYLTHLIWEFVKHTYTLYGAGRTTCTCETHVHVVRPATWNPFKIVLMWWIRQWTRFLCRLPCRDVQRVFCKIPIHQDARLILHYTLCLEIWRLVYMMSPFSIIRLKMSNCKKKKKKKKKKNRLTR